LFVTVDQFYYGFASARFPSVGDSPWLATLWGIVSRAHLVVLAAPFVIRWPRLLGFQVGKTAQYGRMLLVMLLANCGVIAAYLWLTGATTPYSGDQWLVTEAIIVPVVEETIWRACPTILLGLCALTEYASAPRRLVRWAHRMPIWQMPSPVCQLCSPLSRSSTRSSGGRTVTR
jgi:hypothetical protein